MVVSGNLGRSEWLPADLKEGPGHVMAVCVKGCSCVGSKALVEGESGHFSCRLRHKYRSVGKDCPISLHCPPKKPEIITKDKKYSEM
jgi:hypothetical protein